MGFPRKTWWIPAFPLAIVGGIFRFVDDDDDDDDDDDEEHYIVMLSQPPSTCSIDVLVSLSFFFKNHFQH